MTTSVCDSPSTSSSGPWALRGRQAQARRTAGADLGLEPTTLPYLVAQGGEGSRGG